MRTWQDKPYYSLNALLQERFGEKIYRLSLDGGMTCPNRDGKLGTRGCIFCSAGGSGDFAASRMLSITEQIESQKQLIQQKRPVRKFIAYFQAYTNTYAPVSYLRKIFTEAISHPDIVCISIGTRPDCLGPDVMELLSELNQIKPVWVELGLQTIHEKTAAYIRRGYPLSCFENAVAELHERKIDVITHIILGLPGESNTDMLNTVRYLNHLPVSGIKLQLLHVLKNTDLAADYLAGKFQTMDKDTYLNLIIQCLEILSPEIAIHRLTGDGPKDLLIAPLWSSAKRSVLNELHHLLKTKNTWQGRCYTEERL